MTNFDETAFIFKALGDPTRLRIYEFLRGCCCPVALEEGGDVRPLVGPTVGEVCCQVLGADKIPSSLSFHLKELRQAGLITMERRGKNMICGINQKTWVRLTEYFQQKGEVTDECCK